MNFSERAAADHGLEVQQYLALLAIEGYPGRNHVSIGELAERLQIAHHSAVGLVDRLEGAALVKRRMLPEDKRKVIVRLTSQGRRKLEKLANVHRRELKSVGPLLSGLLQQAVAES
ncbi:MAG TPA: MarR family transcriptional regulator [Terrimicrobiaceae bacterium]|nr:MarR family transcriptional regulator [Terrimicrobiaceae bacterium]